MATKSGEDTSDTWTYHSATFHADWMVAPSQRCPTPEKRKKHTVNLIFFHTPCGGLTIIIIIIITCIILPLLITYGQHTDYMVRKLYIKHTVQVIM